MDKFVGTHCYYITIAGNIGVGKSTLTMMLAEQIGWDYFPESIDENPFLANFYDDMPRWGFHSQVYYLAHRFKQQHLLLQCAHSIIQDRCIYEDAQIFARNLYLQGNMSDREWQTYNELYQGLLHFLRHPNLVVYLKASVPTLIRRIRKRGRQSEFSISEGYLAQLSNLYDEWVESFKLCPVLTIETDNLDYVQSEEHLEQIANRINERLHGKDILSLTNNK